MKVKCIECEKIFNLADPVDAEAYGYGHDHDNCTGERE